MKKNGFIWFLLIMMILTMGLSFWKLNHNERKRTSYYKTAEEWALEGAKEDFFFIRESDELYLYTIDEFHICNFDYDYRNDEYDYGKYIRAFKIVMIDEQFNKESYYVVITYNLDNHFMANFKRFFGATKEERFGKEHIVWADCDEI